MTTIDELVVVVFVGQVGALALVAWNGRTLLARGRRSAASAKARARQFSDTVEAVGGASRRIVDHGKSIQHHALHVAEVVRPEAPPGFVVTPSSIRRTARTIAGLRRMLREKPTAQREQPSGIWRLLERVGLVPPLVARLVPAVRTGAKFAGIARAVAAARRNP
ncbi:MAG: hypothetical protein ACKO5K_08390 [Armatimonadota bacterium]